VTVDKDVALEVLDWGGSGGAMVLLAGAGNTAHVYDAFAPKLTSGYHVYGITRRGFGASKYSGTDYAADRLGDDVIAVLDFLKLNPAIVIAHSLGGEELSSIATRHPERVRGLVYLEAAYWYAFDNGKVPDRSEYRLNPPRPPAPTEADTASYSALARRSMRLDGFSFPEAELRQLWDAGPDDRVGKPHAQPPGAGSIAAGMKRFSAIPVPTLVIFAIPHAQGPWIKASGDPTIQKAADDFTAKESELGERQAKALQEAVPTARVVKVAGADHYVFLSNEADVLREMAVFLKSLRD
jgi:pimeloyl-ACP methyl ester carboxylesterase